MHILDDWAKAAFTFLRRQNGTNTELSKDVANTTGRQAARLGFSRKSLIGWAQGAYGRIWVKQTGLNPGLDFKDILKALLKSFDSQRTF